MLALTGSEHRQSLYGVFFFFFYVMSVNDITRDTLCITQYSSTFLFLHKASIVRVKIYVINQSSKKILIYLHNIKYIFIADPFISSTLLCKTFYL